MEISFERIWDSNSDHLQRVLLGLTRDADLTEDCLQDTYIRARSGFAGYAGGSARAWLTTIAKNVYFAIARRKGFNSEEALDTAIEQADDAVRVDSEEYLTLLTIRDAVSALDPALREALIMRHYGGFDYREIAEHLSCSPKMAKHRVWRAMQKLRIALGQMEDDTVRCSELRGPKALDWLYGALSRRRSAEIESHLTICPSCRKDFAEIRRLSTILDKSEGDYRILTLIDLDERGCTTRYVWVRQLNERHDPMHTWRWNGPEGWSIEYLALQGEPVELRWPDVPAEPGLVKFEGDLPSPVPRGGSIDAMFVACPPEGQHWDARQSGDGVWSYHHRHSPFPRREGLFIITIRLPLGAKLINAGPAPQKLSERAGRSSLTWRVMTEIIPKEQEDTKWQFEADLEYSL